MSGPTGLTSAVAFLKRQSLPEQRSAGRFASIGLAVEERRWRLSLKADPLDESCNTCMHSTSRPPESQKHA